MSFLQFGSETGGSAGGRMSLNVTVQKEKRGNVHSTLSWKKILIKILLKIL